MLALPLQMFFYPYLVYKAASTGGGLHEWLGGGWEVGTEAAFWDTAPPWTGKRATLDAALGFPLT